MATNKTAAQALADLKKGNEAYVGGKTGGKPIDDGARRDELHGSQHPFAVVVSCSDSRVPPERLFGVGCGDIFVIRVAGNTVDTTALGSIQYAVAVLKAPLVVVMGHEKCGAVAAAKDVVEKNAKFPGAIGPMIEPIIPAVLEAKAQKGDLLDNAVRANVRRVTEALGADPIVSQGADVIGARYDLKHGTVEFFDQQAVA